MSIYTIPTHINNSLSFLFNNQSIENMNLGDKIHSTKAYLLDFLNTNENNLMAVVKQCLYNNLTGEDLGAYFYDEDLFNDDGEIENSEFLIYNSDINFIFYCFIDEVLAVANDLGMTGTDNQAIMASVNYFIEQCVIEYKESLNHDNE